MVSLACGGGSGAASGGSRGPSVDPATAGTMTATVKFEGTPPRAGK